MNLIDPRTAIVLACCICALMSLLFFSLRRRYPSTIHGLGEWSLAMLMFFAGGILFAGYGIFPDYVATLAILMILSGLTIAYMGTQRFFGVVPNTSLYVFLLGIVLGALTWFLLLDPNPFARLRISNTAMSWLFIAHAYLIHRQPERTFARLFASGVLVMMALTQVLRFVTSFTAPESTYLFDKSLENLIYITSFAFGALLFSTSAVLLVSERVLDELETHRRHLEELVEKRTSELLATEAKASRILESAADGLFGVDREGFITFINPAGCRTLGYSADQAIGRSAHALFHHSRPDGSPYPAIECPSHNAVCTGKEIRVEHETLWHADGHAVPVMLAIHPLLQNDEITGAVTSFVDMSAQDAAAKAREIALTAAESLARAKSEFLANMSHEIRTPMNGVLGFAEIGLRNHHDSEKARNAFEKILTSGKRLLAVVSEILDYSKIEAGKLRVQPVDMSISETVQGALETVAELARAKKLELRLELAPDLPQRCISDPARVGQVLLNLLSNAVKFTETGHVALSASREGTQLVIRVTDTGIGIDETKHEEIFNPFQQADSSSTRQFGGTGLGLAICKRIADLLQGDLSVESKIGTGSTFTFRLPLVEAPAAADGPVGDGLGDEVAPDHPLTGISILVAEDDEINQMLLEANLTADGAQVAMVGNGREAVERVVREGPEAYDIVLMDIQMPEMDGYEATRLIRELAPRLPIVGQTAHALGEDRTKCLAAGMVAHIAKPFLSTELAKLVKQVVSAARDKEQG
ncbi:MAG: response regulator [Rhodocyclales bacterium]|nr:response regulator [Rhodocyclales bacterium]